MPLLTFGNGKNEFNSERSYQFDAKIDFLSMGEMGSSFQFQIKRGHCMVIAMRINVFNLFFKI